MWELQHRNVLLCSDHIGSRKKDMACPAESINWTFNVGRQAATVTLTLLLVLVFSATQPVRAQTFNVIYDFTPVNGNTSTGTLLLDRAGNLYGTTQYGQYGTCGYDGGAFQLKPTKSGWILNPIHCFTAPLGGDDGAFPINYGGLTVGPDGGLYGSTEEGGIEAPSGTSSLGVVFKLSPPPSACLSAVCKWPITILHKFADSPDGSYPHGNVTFDSAGNIYGTTFEGGDYGGIVYQLSPADGGWNETIIHTFHGGNDGGSPQGGLVLDKAGNLYGTAGWVFQIKPSGSGWTYNVIYHFSGQGDGYGTDTGLISDQAGNLYGSTPGGGSGGGGTVFELSPSGDSWTFTTLCNFTGNGGPQSPLTMDAAGNLYGTTSYDGFYGGGSVFKLTKYGNNWVCTDLHDFQQGTGGVGPIGGVTIAPNGTLYGTTSGGGKYGAGVVWEITP